MVAIPLRAHARRTSDRTAAAMLFLSLGCSTADDEEPKGATTGTGTSAASASNTATTGASIGGGGAEAGGSGASDGGGGSAGMGGHGGVGASCDPTRCPPSAESCTVAACVEDRCDLEPAPADTFVSGGMVADCKKVVCDGLGNEVVVDDTADSLDDGNECTTDVCYFGLPFSFPVPTGAPCSQNGTYCDAGQCVTCPPLDGSCTDLDPSEPNGGDSTSTQLAAMTDAEEASLCGVIHDVGDVDWYQYDGTDTQLANAIPSVQILAASPMVTCQFFDCAEGVEDFVCPSNTVEDTSPSGHPGCCGSQPFMVDLWCEPGEEDATVWIRVASGTADACVPYVLVYSF
jgi:hypothetical protein